MTFKSFIPGFIWFVVTVVLLTLPGNDLPHNQIFNIPYFDKYVHFGMFFLLTSFFCYPFLLSFFDDSAVKKWFLIVTGLAILYGILMEYVQKYFVFERSFDLMDMVFDALGAVVALIIFATILSKKIGPNRNRGRNQN